MPNDGKKPLSTARLLRKGLQKVPGGLWHAKSRLNIPAGNVQWGTSCSVPRTPNGASKKVSANSQPRQVTSKKLSKLKSKAPIPNSDRQRCNRLKKHRSAKP